MDFANIVSGKTNDEINVFKLENNEITYLIFEIIMKNSSGHEWSLLSVPVKYSNKLHF